MTQQEIAARVCTLNEIIKSNFNPGQFILNSKVVEAYDEIDELQKICNHEYEDGFCKYCYYPEN